MSRKFVLTIDGGGIRCVIPAVVLVELEKRLWQAGKRQPLYEYVDLFAGSAIGALMAAALCCPQPGQPDELVASPASMLYQFTSGDHFGFTVRPDEDGACRPYCAETFETRLKTVFGAEAVLNDALTRLLVPAYDLQKRQPVMMGNLCPSHGHFYVWQAIRAACAVPTYFAPALVENRALTRPRGTPLMPLINGGSLASDPAMAAYVEASKLGWNRDGSEMTILSLGSGLDPRPIPFLEMDALGSHGTAITAVNPALLTFAAELDCAPAHQLNALMNGEVDFDGISTRVTARNRRHLSYFRLNRELSRSSQADDITPENIGRLVGEATQLIADNSALLDEVVSRMG